MAMQTRRLFAAEKALMKKLGQDSAGTAPARMAAPSGNPEETKQILDAIADLKETIIRNTDPKLREDLPELGVLRGQLQEMADSIELTKKEIAAVRHPEAADDRLTSAAMELDAIVKATEDATHNILSATEDIEDKLAIIKDRAADVSVQKLIDEIGNLTIKIFENCNFQDITGQRTNKVVKTIYFLEDRVMNMIEIWGGAEEFKAVAQQEDVRDDDEKLLEGPQQEGAGVSQADIDALFD